MLLIQEPTKVRLQGYENKVKELQKHLQYHNKPIDHEIARMKRNSAWIISSQGEEYYRETLEDLKAKRIGSLLFEDEQGYWTYSGLANYIADRFQDEIVNTIEYPEPKLLPWDHPPDKVLRYYQSDSIVKLIAAKHGSVEICTGGGKSRIITDLIKHYALPTLVMVPNQNLGYQMLEQLTYHFGSKYVGQYFDGKKDCKKLITIGLPQSLSKIEIGNNESCQFFKNKQVLLSDESHLVPSNTLDKVCTQLVSNAPYRFFFSGTQTRGDGKELVLHGIIGNIVYDFTVRQGVNEGFLSKPIFKIVQCTSSINYTNSDPLRMIKKHFYYNMDVIRKAAYVANQALAAGKPTVILINEIEQFSKLLPLLNTKPYFAHGTLNKDNKKYVPEEYVKCDTHALVKDFNAKKFPLLIGTDCISLGTDIQPVECIVYLQGGTGEVQTSQSVGRGTRLYAGKKNCVFVDFDVTNVDICHRHCQSRIAIYNDIYGPVKYVDLEI